MEPDPRQVGIADGHLQRLKAAVRRHQSVLTDMIGAITMTTAEQGRQVAALGEGVGTFVAVWADSAPQLAGSAYVDEWLWLEQILGVSGPGLGQASGGRNTKEPALRMRPDAPVRRVAQRAAFAARYCMGFFRSNDGGAASAA